MFHGPCVADLPRESDNLSIIGFQIFYTALTTSFIALSLLMGKNKPRYDLMFLPRPAVDRADIDNFIVNFIGTVFAASSLETHGYPPRIIVLALHYSLIIAS